MKFQLAVSALAATAVAVQEEKVEKRQAPFNTASALNVIATALPSSLLGLAITNSAAASSEIASEFAAGATPSWYSALPSDIKTYLVPANSAAATSGGASVLSSALSSASATAAGVMPPRVSMGTSMPYGTNATSGMGVAGMGTGASGAGGASMTPYMSSTPSMSGSGSSSTGGSGSGMGGSGGSSASRGSGSGGSSASTGGVPAQTAAFGMGIAGVAAAVGMLAL